MLRSCLSAGVFVVVFVSVAFARPGAPAHDDVRRARVVSELPFLDTTDTRAATTEPHEDRSCAGVGATVWYRFSPEDDVVIVADTVGSDFDTVLAVYAGTRLRSLQQIACNDDAEGLQSRLELELAGGGTYYFQVGGYAASTGALVFNVRDHGTGNDDFANAFEIHTLPFLHDVDTRAATVEPDEPEPCAPIGATVWYRYVPETDGPISANTAGSDFDTVLAVYRGTDLSDLEPVACNDDANDSLLSAVTVHATGGETFYVQVGGYAGSVGSLRLNVDAAVPNDHRAEARPVDVLPFFDVVRTFHATLEPGEPRPCAGIGATVWYRLTPALPAVVRADTAGSDYDTVLAVYADLPGVGLVPLECNDDSGDVTSAVEVHALPGVSYYFQAGGFLSGQGTLMLNVNAR